MSTTAEGWRGRCVAPCASVTRRPHLIRAAASSQLLKDSLKSAMEDQTPEARNLTTGSRSRPKLPGPRSDVEAARETPHTIGHCHPVGGAMRNPAAQEAPSSGTKRPSSAISKATATRSPIWPRRRRYVISLRPPGSDCPCCWVGREARPSVPRRS